MALSGMRGLSVFISDVRNSQNKEQERIRVDKELGHIRTRFKNEKLLDLMWMAYAACLLIGSVLQPNHSACSAVHNCFLK